VKLSRYLVGRRSAPVEVGAIPEVWAALAKLHADGNAERFAGLITLLADDPRKALECLGRSSPRLLGSEYCLPLVSRCFVPVAE
jgi:hypothetical protein